MQVASRVRLGWISAALVVVAAGIGFGLPLTAVPVGCRSTPRPSATHYGTFTNNGRGWWGADPALDADNKALQAFLDARVRGSCAEPWIGLGVKIGQRLYKGPEGTYYGWGLYSFHDSPFCLQPGESVGPGGRYSRYSINTRFPSAAAAPRVIGNAPGAAAGRYAYAILIGGSGAAGVFGGSMRYFIEVVGPGVNRYGKHLPAVILGEFEQVLFSECGPQGRNIVGGI